MTVFWIGHLVGLASGVYLCAPWHHRRKRKHAPRALLLAPITPAARSDYP